MSKSQQTQQTARFQSLELELIKAQSERGGESMLKMLKNIIEGIKSWREDQDTVNKEGKFAK